LLLRPGSGFNEEREVIEAARAARRPGRPFSLGRFCQEKRSLLSHLPEKIKARGRKDEPSAHVIVKTSQKKEIWEKKKPRRLQREILKEKGASEE